MWWPLLSSCAWSIWTRSLGSLLSSVIMSTASRKCICKIIRYSLVHINVKRRCTPTHLIVFSCENFMQHRDLKPNHILQIMNEFGSAITLVSVLQMFLFFSSFCGEVFQMLKKRAQKKSYGIEPGTSCTPVQSHKMSVIMQCKTSGLCIYFHCISHHVWFATCARYTWMLPDTVHYKE